VSVINLIYFISLIHLITKMTNRMQLCVTIYCSLTALHVSRDIFAHHPELLNCIYGFWYYSRMWLPAGVMDELERSYIRE